MRIRDVLGDLIGVLCLFALAYLALTSAHVLAPMEVLQ